VHSLFSSSGKLLHRIVDCSTVNSHTSISEKAEPLQVLVSLRHKSSTPDPHFHLYREKDTSEKIQESWYVVSGKILCHLFNEENELMESVTLQAGWLCVTYAGGHSFEVLEDAILLEHKTGPYSGRADDKQVFPGP
jgi:hypothetical protein